MLTIKDILDFAKAGWKPADVKEVIELSKTADVKETDTTDSPSNDEPPEEPAVTAPVQQVIPETETEKEEVDYKSLYESTKIELDKAQKVNSRLDISSSEDKKTDEDILKDLFKEFM